MLSPFMQNIYKLSSYIQSKNYWIKYCMLFQVERVEVRDVRLPQQLQRAMAAEAEAGREARLG